MKPWITHSIAPLLDRSPFLRVENRVVELPDGRIVPDWPWIVTPDYVTVAALTPDNTFLCFRQTKYAADGLTLAPVGGYLEPGENPLAAAQRELLEEAGCRASSWVSLGRYAVDGNRGAGVAHFFLAQNVIPAQPPTADDLEEQQPVFLTRSEVERALATGQFKVLAWPAVMALALLHLAKCTPGQPASA